MNEDAIRTLLNGIVDPCSRAAGTPAGLVDMGLVRRVSVTAIAGEYDVRVTLCVTEPGCVMGGCFAREAEIRLAELPGIRSVSIELDGAADWTPTDMSASYRVRLAAVRAARFSHRAAHLPPGVSGSPSQGSPEGMSGKSRLRHQDTR